MLMNNVVFGNPSQQCVDVVIEYVGEMAIIHAKAKRVINKYVNPITIKEYTQYVKKPSVLQQMFGVSLDSEIEKKVNSIKENAEKYLEYSATGRVVKKKEKKKGFFKSLVGLLKEMI